MTDQETRLEPFYPARGQANGSVVHGLNTAFLIEKITRERILDSIYFKDQCFGLTASTILDRIVQLQWIGGVNHVRGGRPSEFQCLLFKLLQLNPSREIIMYYLQDDEFKYLRALILFYVRLTFVGAECYNTLEPYLLDPRKLRVQTESGWHIMHVDELVDRLLTESRVFEMALPALLEREKLEDLDELEPRESPLQAELEEDQSNET